MKKTLIKLFSIVTVLGCLLLVGCQMDKSSIVQAKKQTLRIAQIENKLVDIKLPKELNDEIFQWFEDEPKDWNSPLPPFTYAPQVMIRNEFISINMRDSSLVVNIQNTNGKHLQFDKEVDSDRCQWMKKINQLIEDAMAKPDQESSQ